jgi:hypothetical protein
MWIVPFKGRNHSGCYEQNFLWKNENIYIMDNHRAALWCWFQHLSKDSKIAYFHIDKHTDTLQSKIKEWVNECPDLWSISIDDYLSHIHTRDMGMDIPLFRWDNYASIFLQKHSNLVSHCFFATHNVGDPANHHRVQNPDIWDLAGNLSYWLKDTDQQWIFNLDLDYFFYASNSDEYSVFLSDEYIEQIFITIKKYLDNKKILCLTICLSPECCGSWEAAEGICAKGAEILGIDFELPK